MTEETTSWLGQVASMSRTTSSPNPMISMNTSRKNQKAGETTDISDISDITEEVSPLHFHLLIRTQIECLIQDHYVN